MSRRPLTTILVVCLAACGRRHAAAPAPTSPPVPTSFDHVIIAIDTIERGIALLRAATGVEPRVVEREPDGGPSDPPERGYGTQSGLLMHDVALRSALLDLGGGRYLELIGVDQRDPGAARLNEIYAGHHDLTVLAWGVRTANADSLRAALRSAGIRSAEPRPGERRLVSGDVLRWRTLTPWENVSTMYPAFIEWAPSSAHPSQRAPGGCSIVSFTLATPYAASMRSRLERAGVSATVDSAARENLALTLDCPAGRVRLPPASL